MEGETVMKIDVTAADIQLGRPRTITLCPVARAIRRATKSRHGLWSVCESFILCGKIRHKTPRKVAAFIRRFDNQKPVEPFSFELKVKE